MKQALLVAAGGAIGSLARWGLSGLVQRWSRSTFPWGTFAVNALGSFAIGLVAAIALERALVSPNGRLFLIVGVLGGFTTFSAYSFESAVLLRDGQWLAATGYAGGSALVCILAASVGLAIGLRL